MVLCSNHIDVGDPVATLLAIVLDCFPALGNLVVAMVGANVPFVSFPLLSSGILEEYMQVHVAIFMLLLSNHVLLHLRRY